MRIFLLGLIAMIAAAPAAAAPADKSKAVDACATALEASASRPTPSILDFKQACQPLYVGRCNKGWDLAAVSSDATRAYVLLASCGEEYCPKLAKETLAACKGGELTRVEDKKMSAALRELHTRILMLELGKVGAAKLTVQFDKVWSAIFP